ncbi:MAG: toll/interleukin-1 receptor domain-containing protein [Alphaproteobacteria bacterium]
MADIFISYLRPDWPVAARVAAALERAGYTVAWDFPSWVGEDLIDAIDRERATARTVLVLWSRDSVASARIRVEALAAFRERHLVQARLSRLEAPPPFRTLPLADLVAWRGDPEAPCIDILRGLISRTLQEPNRPTLLSLGVGAWRFPVQARARQAALYALPFLALPIAVSGAKGLSHYLVANGLTLERITAASTADPADAAAPPVIPSDALLAETGLCPAPIVPAGPDVAAGSDVPAGSDAPSTEGKAVPAAAVRAADAVGGGGIDAESLSDLIYAAMRRDVEAQYRLGLHYLNDAGQDRDTGLGLAWIEKAADGGHTAAQMELASLALSDDGPLARDPVIAAKWYERAAEDGHADAQYNLAVLLMSGETGRRDPAQARVWFEKAADQGLIDAAYNVGVLYANGWGIRADHPRAVTYLTRAAEAGRGDAAWALGLLYHEGDERVRDLSTAVHWFKRAAQANHPNAQFVMSILHIKGEGVTQSNPLAYVWLELAMANGADQAALKADLTAVLSDLQAAAALDAIAAASRCLGIGETPETDEAPVDLTS